MDEEAKQFTDSLTWTPYLYAADEKEQLQEIHKNFGFSMMT